MLAKVHSSAVLGVEGIGVTVEVDISNGLPAFTIVGLPDGTVRESKDRVKSAIKNSSYPFPPKKITVNLAPADLKKEGAVFDLPIALGILSASGVIPQESLADFLVLGELSLDGSIRPVSGVLPVVTGALQRKIKKIIIPLENVNEAALVREISILPVSSLHETVERLSGIRDLVFSSTTKQEKVRSCYQVRFEHVKGQETIKRALEIAAAGHHNVLMSGPPGTGKTMIARSIPSILPEPEYDEIIETSKIYSVAGINGTQNTFLFTERPFRAPHHTVSDAGMVGGGVIPKPGEVSLAHNGVLFLDELPEFRRNVLEVLRQPLEDGVVSIARARKSITFPARFMLIASMNPCPCGYYGSNTHECHCNELQIRRYQNKISAPLLDRIDIHLQVRKVEFDDLHNSYSGDTSSEIRKRVNLARKIQKERFAEEGKILVNSQMGPKEIENFCGVDIQSSTLLKKSVERFGLSARAYHRILKLARTIADLENKENISFSHVAEAIQFRRGNCKN